MKSLRIGAAALVLAAVVHASGCATGVATKPTVGGTGGDDTSGGSGGATVGTATASGTATSAMSSSSTGVPTTCTMKADCVGLDDACNLGNCVNGMCARAPANDGAACDDGLYCTENEACMGGTCVGGSQKFCPSPDSCHVGSCDEATKTCGSAAGNDGASCDDGDPCTYSGSCSGGTCSKGPPVDCSAFDGTCSMGFCDPVLGCQGKPLNDGASCDDGLFCTFPDTCKAGACSGPPNPCAPATGCYIASCDEVNAMCTAVPGNDGAACDDFNSCTKGTTCSNGACINGSPDNNGAMCDDGSACTSMTTCNAGVCGGGIGPTVYFADDFHDNSKGWMLDTEWQIGPAKASIPVDLGPDPGIDHTATADNGIAGVDIGDSENPVIHPPYYMTSPPFNTANAQGSVVFGFYRWLNSDYDPYMHDYVDVWDGSKWVNLWTSGVDEITDTMWTYEMWDVTAYKNAGMRVRIGFDIGSAGVFTVGSWNVDDVLVASASCP